MGEGVKGGREKERQREERRGRERVVMREEREE